MIAVSSRALAPVLPLLFLLTWLTVESQGTSGEAYVFAQRDVARVSLGEAALRASVLEARAGLLRDDDVLNDDLRVLDTSVAELRRQARVRPQDTPFLDQLAVVAARDDAALELFKTDNALLQNARSYFTVLDTGLARANADHATETAVTALGNAMLLLMNDASPQTEASARANLDALASIERATPPGDDRDQLRLLIAHGNVLARLLPEVNGDLADMFRISTYDLRQAIRHGQDARRVAEENRAGRYRVALYLVAILLALLLTRYVFQWRAGQMLLRQRAELEHLIADLSARLIAVLPEQFDAVMDDIVAQLGRGFGADRAYLALPGPGHAKHLWCRSRFMPHCPPDWPARLLAEVSAAGALGETLDAVDVRRLENGALKFLLVDGGLRGWCGVLLRLGRGRIGLLGFDLVEPARSRFSPAPTNWPRGGTGMVRLAGEIAQGALDRYHALLERRELETRLGRARRLESVGAFASGIAHNVNNVISAIAGHVEMAKEVSGADPVIADHLREIGDAVDRAQELVTAILAFGTRGQSNKRTVTVADLLDGTFSLTRAFVPPAVTLVLDTRMPDAFLHGEVAHLQQVFVNLVRNACQAMAESGRITVTAERDAVGSERRLSHDVLLPGDYARVTVADDGPGMSERILARIFEPFFTSRPGGTGLGLATAREVVHDHGGAFDVRSRPGEGTVFTVWLSLAHVTRSPERTRRGNGEPVLLLSPDRSVRLSDEEMLAALSYEPAGFTDHAVALVEARSAQDRFAALLLDTTTLPSDLDGLSLVRRFRESGVAAPVILVAAAATPQTGIEETAALDVVAILSRPLRIPPLAEALSRCTADTIPRTAS